MPFILPTFNLTCNVWNEIDVLTGPGVLGAPTVVDCNNQFGRKHAGLDDPAIWCLMPKLTDIRDPRYDAMAFIEYFTIVESPSGSARYYLVNHVEDVAKGFATEYRVGVLTKVWYYQPDVGWEWPIPYP